MASKDTDVAGKHGRERRRDFGDGSTAAVVVVADSDGVPASKANPATVRLERLTPLDKPLFNPVAGSNMAGDFTVGLSPLLIYDAVNTQWTAASVTGSSFTAVSGAQSHSGGSSALWDNPDALDVIRFFRPTGSEDLTPYDQLTIWIYVVSGWGAPGDAFEVYGWNGDVVGVPVDLAPFFPTTEFGVWHPIEIPLSTMLLTGETVTEFRLRMTAKSGQGPTFHLDDIRAETPGGAVTFSASAPVDTEWEIHEILLVIKDSATSTLTAGIDPDAILGAPAATNGLVFQEIKNGSPTDFGGQFQNIGDSPMGGFLPAADISDAAGAVVAYRRDMRSAPLVITGDPDDNRLQLTVNNNDLSALDSVFLIAFGGTRPV